MGGVPKAPAAPRLRAIREGWLRPVIEQLQADPDITRPPPAERHLRRAPSQARGPAPGAQASQCAPAPADGAYSRGRQTDRAPVSRRGTHGGVRRRTTRTRRCSGRAPGDAPGVARPVLRRRSRGELVRHQSLPRPRRRRAVGHLTSSCHNKVVEPTRASHTAALGGAFPAPIPPSAPPAQPVSSLPRSRPASATGIRHGCRSHAAGARPEITRVPRAASAGLIARGSTGYLPTRTGATWLRHPCTMAWYG